MNQIIDSIFQDFSLWDEAIEHAYGKRITDPVLKEFCSVEGRIRTYAAICTGDYHVDSPHVARIPKPNKPGEYRLVYANSPRDRILFHAFNVWITRHTRDMIHPAATAYQEGKSCAKTVQSMARRMNEGVRTPSDPAPVAWVYDLTKYFDTVPLRYIDRAFDQLESRFGKDALLDLVRDYYHREDYIDLDGELRYKPQSLKQGCAVASWLANVVLYDIDRELYDMAGGKFVRYSDDTCCWSDNMLDVKARFEQRIAEMDMTLNAEKLKWVHPHTAFRFLGFSLQGAVITLGAPEVHNICRDMRRMILNRKTVSLKGAVNIINRYLYNPHGEYSWAGRVLRNINSLDDLQTLDQYFKDVIRAAATRRTRIGGLGFVPGRKGGCIVRGRGRNVTSNRERTDAIIPGYQSLIKMRNALLTSRAAYEMLVREMM